MGIDFNLSQQHTNFTLWKLVFQRLLQHIANHSLTFRAENVERIGGDAGIRTVLQRQKSNLRAIAVHQNHAPLLCELSDSFCRQLNVLALDVSFQRLAAFEQRIAAQRHNQSRFVFHDFSLNTVAFQWAAHAACAAASASKFVARNG